MEEIRNVFLVALLASLFHGRVDAASVTWQSVRAVADVADLDTNGTAVLATYWSGVSGSNVINGVAFTDSGANATTQNGVTATVMGSISGYENSANVSLYGGFYSAWFQGQGAGPGGASYAAMLGCGVWGGTGSGALTLSLSGLTAGHQYRVQFWEYDSRSVGSGLGETITGSGTDTNPPTLHRRNASAGTYNCNGGTYVIGSFAAAAATQTFTVTDTSFGAQINGFQLRDVTGAPVAPASPFSPVMALGTAAYAGQAFSYQLACFSAATNYAATSLPPGLSLNATTGVISGTPSDAGVYQLTISGICAGVTYQATMIIAIAQPDGTPVLSTSVPRGYWNHVAEATNYTLVYALNLPWTGNFNTVSPPYSVDLHTNVGPFTRVAYYLELQAPGGTLQYAWVSMNAFTTNAAQIGVPTTLSGASFQQTATNLNVVSDVPGVATGTGLTGSLDFTPQNGGWMVVSNAGQAVFGLNNWGGGSGYVQAGIGSNSVPATNYVVRSLQVLALNSATNLTIQPVKDDLSLLINPGKGYAEYGGPSKYTANATGVGYSRWDWSVIEPAEGVYNWSVVDNFISAFAAYGLQSAIGIISADCLYTTNQPTPAWVFQPGTNAQTGAVYTNGAASIAVLDACGDTNKIVVAANWNDPVYLARLHDFITAFAARYDGNTNLAYLDMRDYGLWGEGNGNFGTGTTNVLPGQLLTNYYLPYVQAFTNSQLLEDAWYGSVGGALASLGTGSREDGICNGGTEGINDWNGSMVLFAYPYHPAVMEYWGLPTNVYRLSPENELMIYVAAAAQLSAIQWRRALPHPHELLQPGGQRDGLSFCAAAGFAAQEPPAGRGLSAEFHLVKRRRGPDLPALPGRGGAAGRQQQPGPKTVGEQQQSRQLDARAERDRKLHQCQFLRGSRWRQAGGGPVCQPDQCQSNVWTGDSGADGQWLVYPFGQHGVGAGDLGQPCRRQLADQQQLDRQRHHQRPGRHG